MLLLATALGTANLWRRRVETRRRLWWITAPLLLLMVLCTPLVARLAVSTLVRPQPSMDQQLEGVEAIVVLGGYVLPPTDDRPARLGWDSYNRCLRAAELYRQGSPRLVLLSGGKVDSEQPGPTISAAMGEFLLRYDIPAEDLLLEERSRNTYENAVESSRLLRQRGIRRVVLVTESIHVPRAEACFRRQGVEVVPAGWSGDEFEWSLRSFLPQPDAANQLQRVVHEWVGILYYRLAGRI